ncbi:exocyst complex component Sec10-like protein [Lactarius indigo]|nr:exocyst complex component Sec10-like protein [Lactarius indigo]
MDKFKALEPVKLHQGLGSASSSQRFVHSHSPRSTPLIGRLPSSLHLLILQYIPVPDVPAYARTNRALARLAASEPLWEHHYNLLSIDRYGFGPVLDELESRARKEAPEQPPTLTVDVAEDDFGDFTSGTDAFGFGFGGFPTQSGTSLAEVGNFIGSETVMQGTNALGTTPFRALYIRAHRLLRNLSPALLEPPHQILASLFPPTTASAPPLSLLHRSKTLHLLHLFLFHLEPLRSAPSLLSALRAASDRFDAALLSAFDVSDGRADEAGMREAAEASWEIWEPHESGSGGIAEWEMGRVWAEKREIFYVTSAHKPLDNFTSEGGLNFEAMDAFMGFVLDALREHGSRAVRVFPPAAGVLLSFADRIATEVVSEYIAPLLTHARSLANGVLFLKATAACFREAWRIVDTLLELASQRHPPSADKEVSKAQAEDVVYRMFEPNMDEYLDEEIDSLKQTFGHTYRDWEKKTSVHTDESPLLASQQPTFLASSSPAHLKSNVLSTFTNLLLIPVSIVPRTVETVSGAAVHGIAMLDPRRWGGAGQVNGNGLKEGYTKGTDSTAVVLWEDELEDSLEDSLGEVTSEHGENATAPTTTSASPQPPRLHSYDNLQLLLSLDVTLELIHATRESLKRVEIFVGYPGTYGVRVRETIEELATEMLGVLGERHVRNGFELAITQMRAYQPPALSDSTSDAERLASASTSVAPLVQFFELVHIGDMIQSIVQVYFDKELAPHVDLTDFLNLVVREKKRFENLLDDSVAKGLNAGIEVLMNQVDHIITTLTPPRTYYPPEEAPLLLGPSKGCTEAIKCLEEHIRLLQGNVNREVLEVFEGEVGVRLIGILQKHIKRQIISLNGGFQVIADLNAYHTFISSLKIQSLTSDFANLKMLGHVFIVEDAKDLAQIVRDVTRYGGAYRPEDIYEFIQRRSDWKKIEKVVDKTMYNLNLREDCIIS